MFHIRYLRVALLTLLLLPAIGWLTFPLWAPLAARPFLPDGWQLHELDIGRPGWHGITVHSARADVAVIGLPVGVQVEGARMAWRGDGYQADRVDIDLSRTGLAGVAAATGGPGLGSLRDIAIPRLVLPGNLPDLRIGRLVVTGLSPNGETFVLDELVLDPEDNNTLDFDSDFPELPFVNRPGHLAVRATPERFEATLSLDPVGPGNNDFANERGEMAGFLSLLQQRQDGELQTRLTAELPLAAIDPDWLGQQLPDEWRRATASGELGLDIGFAGPVPQQAETIDLALRAVTLDTGEHRVTTTADLRVRWEAPAYVIRLQEDATMTLTGAADQWPPHIGSVLASLALTLPVPGGEISAAGAWLGASTEITVGAERPWPTRIVGPVDLRLAAGDDTGFVAGFEPLRLDLAGLAPLAPLSFDAPLRLALRTPGPVTLALDEAGLTLGGVDISGRGTLQVRENALEQLHLDTVDVTLASASLAPEAQGQAIAAAGVQAGGALDFGAGGWRFEGPASGESVRFSPTGGEGLSVNGGAWAFDLVAGAHAGPATGTTPIITTGNGQVDGLALPDFGLASGQVQLDWRELDLDALSGQARVSTSGLSMTADDGSVMSGFDIDATAQLPANGPVTGEGTFRAGSFVAIPFSYRADLDSGITTATLSDAPLPAMELGRLAGVFGVAWPEGVYINSGDIRLDGQLRLAEGLAGEVDAVATGIEAGFAESTVHDLAANLHLVLGETIGGGGEVTALRLTLAAGLDLDNLALDVILADNGDLLANGISGTLFGGQLAIAEAGWVDGALAPATVDWQGFDMNTLLRFMDVNGLDGSGTLDAVIPVSQSGDGIAVTGGAFTATGPGRIAYTAGAPATNIGLQALENFHFDSFSGTIDYDPAGPYAVKMDLLGRNPDLYGGHPVKFGLNLGGEMPAVFKSLFLTGSFEEALLERLRESSEPLP
ncbi:hypothetical protein F3N42_05355 [Marinihelvus fidelis]|uniref:Uncharacterized protein n=1 Tax=Marinihelvus fidelis TaxID=2613842 RepID=A0A5N0TFJ2_9GAMM|nr:YdbH domain-containing protein [Marinihelvus fidelis]KAA9132646.1 hypothetical protein F3N42_05355 [Marinihelvus fidelis]